MSQRTAQLIQFPEWGRDSEECYFTKTVAEVQELIEYAKGSEVIIQHLQRSLRMQENGVCKVGFKQLLEMPDLPPKKK